MKRVELINRELGVHIRVTEDREDEYLKAGYVPAGAPAPRGRETTAQTRRQKTAKK